MPLPLTPRRVANRKDKSPSKSPAVEVGQPTGPYDNHSVRERVRLWQAQGGGVVFTTDNQVDGNDDTCVKTDVQKLHKDHRKSSASSTVARAAEKKNTTPKRRSQQPEPHTSDTHRRRARRDKSGEPLAQQRPRSASAPRRRIVSDSHWRADRAAFEDSEQYGSKKKTRPSWAVPDDGIRVRPMLPETAEPPCDQKQRRRARQSLFDDGIRVYGTSEAAQDNAPRQESEPASVFMDETCTLDNLTFHTPTPSEREMTGTRYSCDASLHFNTQPRHRGVKGDGLREINDLMNTRGKAGVRFAEPSKPEKKGKKRISKSGIFGNVLEESKKIFARSEPHPVPETNMPTIESWLSGTPDPFMDGPSFGPSNEPPDTLEDTTEDLREDPDTLLPHPDALVNDSEQIASPKCPTTRSGTGHPSADPNEIWDTLNSSNFESAQDRIRPQRHRRARPRMKGPDLKGEEDDKNGASGDTFTLQDSPIPPERNDEEHDSSPSSLKRRGAYKKSSRSDRSGRNGLSALKAAFRGDQTAERQLSSSVTSDHPCESGETIEPLRIRKKVPTDDVHSKKGRLSTVASVGPVNRRATKSERQHNIGDGNSNGTISSRPVDPDAAIEVLTRVSSKSRITKHADLMSMLSHPNVQRGQSLRSARSLRNSRGKANTLSLPEIMSELADEESKYMRELRTLVDGVIPVLLSSILSKSESAVTVSLYSHKKAKDDPNVTKPIYDMGIALERLKRAHKKIAIDKADSFLAWARSAQYIYWDYLQAWRMGFQDVVVNLAPADAKTNAAPDLDSAVNGGLERDETGDVVDNEGERVDVAFLLKRPLIRLKHLAKTITSINKVQPNACSEEMDKKYQDLVEEARNRVKEERARLEDEAAAAIDSTRVRSLQTLAPTANVVIDDSRRVRARDCFNLTLYHTSCQVLDCRVELLLRENHQGKEPSGDVLICEVDGTGRWLLFPPISIGDISARNGESKGEIVVMIRGTSTGEKEWHELLSLHSDEEESGFEWVQMLGLVPIPPHVQRSQSFRERREKGMQPPQASTVPRQPVSTLQSTQPQFRDIDVPLGEQALYESETVATPLEPNVKDTQPRERTRLQKQQHPVNPLPLPHEDIMELPVRFNQQRKDKTIASSLPSFPSDGYREPLLDSQERQLPPNPFQRTSVDPKLRKPVTPSKSSEQSSCARLNTTSKPLDSQNKSKGSGAEYSPAPKEPRPPHTTVLSSVSVPQVGSLLSSAPTRPPTSPLKNQYEPSTASEASSRSDTSSIRQDASSASDSDDADLEDGDIAMPLLPPGALNHLKSAPKAQSLYQAPPVTISPSDSASQAPYKHVPAQPSQATKTIASIFYWSQKGSWESLHPDECSIVVTPGLIEAFEMSAQHSSLLQSGPGDPSISLSRASPTNPQPFIGLELTPLVPIRRGTALDISVRSPPTAESKIKNIQNTNIMFRSRNSEECDALYTLINHARINNPTYIALQNARATSFSRPFGGATFEGAKDASRSSWFGFGSGNRSSYRASSAPTPSAARKSESSTGSAISAFSALRRFGLRSSRFSIARSTITSRQGGSRASGSVFSSSEQSSSSGTSTPLPPNIAGAMGVVDSSGIGAAPIGLGNTKIRLYIRETASKWRDLGHARLTIMRPSETEDGQGLSGGGGAPIAGDPTAQSAPLPQSINGTEIPLRAPGSGRPSATDKRVLVTSKKTGETLLDVTLGESCFERVARTGIAVSVWETLHADGQVGKQGGVVGGKFRVYMMQMQNEAETAYTFGIVGKFRY